MTPFNLTDSFNTRGWRHLIARQHSQRESSVPSGEVSPLGDALCQGRRRASRGSPDPQGPNPPSTSPTLPPKTHREADARPQGGVLAETTERSSNEAVSRLATRLLRLMSHPFVQIGRRRPRKERRQHWHLYTAPPPNPAKQLRDVQPQWPFRARRS
ncbi:uncharacterized protein LOC144199320 isoform X1 [Stigmatopora nigra]